MIFKFEIKQENKKVQDFLRGKGFSYEAVKNLKKEMGLIKLNGKDLRGTDLLTEGILEVNVKAKQNTKIKLNREKIEVLAEDEFFLAVNKPPFISTIPNGKKYKNLAGMVLNYLNNETTFMPINRLDIETSGIVLIAKTAVMQHMLKSYNKTYFAFATGKTPESGEINIGIARDDLVYGKRKASENGKESLTKYKRISYSEKLNISFVKIELVTGRTHQIRVHFNYIRHPLLGDTLYGEKSSLLNRTALHAAEISFTHPITDEEIKISAEIPTDIKEVLNLF